MEDGKVPISTTLDSQARQKQIFFWNTFTFMSLKNITDLYDRKASGQPPTQSDFAIRDFYFSGKLPPLKKYQPQQTLFERASNYLNQVFTFDKQSFLQAQLYDAIIMKHQFWKRLKKLKIKNREDVNSKSQVTGYLYISKLFPYVLFALLGVITIQITGLKHVSWSKKGLGFATYMFFVDYGIEKRISSSVFYNLHNLDNKQLEKQRNEILNQCVFVDGQINKMRSINSRYSELIQSSKHKETIKAKQILLKLAGLKNVMDPNSHYLKDVL